MPDPAQSPSPDPPVAGTRLSPSPPRHGTRPTARPAHRPVAKPAHKPVAKPAPKAPLPKPSAEERERGRIVGLVMIGLAAVIAVVVTIGIFLPAIGEVLSGAPRPVDVGALPEAIGVCEREYVRAPGTDGEPRSLEAARALAGSEPVVVGAGGGCPEGVCVRAGACLGTVFVQTTDGRYVAYVAGEST